MTSSQAPTTARRQPGVMTLDVLERRFDEIAGDQPHITAEALRRALGLSSAYLAQRMLMTLDTNGDGVVSREEFLEGVRALVYGSDRDRLHFAFRLHDHDQDGFLSLHELERMIDIGLAEDGLVPSAEESSEVLAKRLIQAADRDGDGRLSFADLESLVQQRPALMREMARSEALWMAPNRDLLARMSAPPASPQRKARRYLRNYTLPAAFLALAASANLAIFFAILWANPRGPLTDRGMQLGRATGAALSFDVGLLLLPIMRRLLTRVRGSWLGRVVPVDSAVGFHKLMGRSVALLTLAHVAAFTVARFKGHPGRLLSGLGHLYFLTERGLTGTLLLVLGIILGLGALAWTRRSKRFEVFYFTHLLYAPWLVLLVIHAPEALIWLGLPLSGFLLEQLLRRLRRGRATRAIAIEPLRSRVTLLKIARPLGFDFHSTDYVFVRVPAIARHEWHPFTLSSAPESDLLTLHVRTLGNWTSALRGLAEERAAGFNDDELEIYLDGPYGSPSTHLFRSRFAVWIGAGIGVTPFASVLESLVSREEHDDRVAVQKAHFYWLNRDPHSFEWFHDLLEEVERRDTRGVLDLHLHITGGRTGATAFGLELARDLAHAGGRPDLATGLQSKTHMAAPDWRSELATIARMHAPHEVDVYFCGPHGLGIKLRRICAELGLAFREEKF